jgi:dTDP-4-dehydrorhamnose 3,5-epimerase-like enzyme
VEVAKSVQIGSKVMINAAFSSPAAEIKIEEGVVIGDGSVVVGPLSIGAFAVVRPGSIVTRSIPQFAIVEGNPAQVVGYVSSSLIRGELVEPPHEVGARVAVAGCEIWRLPLVADLRGNLTYAELGQFLPFQPKRFFLVFDVPSEKIRGSHAHHELHELLICVKGSVIVTMDNGSECRQIMLNDPTVMLHLRPKTWTTQYNYSSDAVLLVLCSHPYEADDYIRDYDVFLEVCREHA